MVWFELGTMAVKGRQVELKGKVRSERPHKAKKNRWRVKSRKRADGAKCNLQLAKVLKKRDHCAVAHLSKKPHKNKDRKPVLRNVTQHNSSKVATTSFSSFSPPQIMYQLDTYWKITLYRNSIMSRLTFSLSLSLFEISKLRTVVLNCSLQLEGCIWGVREGDRSRKD